MWNINGKFLVPQTLLFLGQAYTEHLQIATRVLSAVENTPKIVAPSVRSLRLFGAAPQLSADPAYILNPLLTPLQQSQLCDLYLAGDISESYGRHFQWLRISQQ